MELWNYVPTTGTQTYLNMDFLEIFQANYFEQTLTPVWKKYYQ